MKKLGKLLDNILLKSCVRKMEEFFLKKYVCKSYMYKLVALQKFKGYGEKNFSKEKKKKSGMSSD